MHSSSLTSVAIIIAGGLIQEQLQLVCGSLMVRGKVLALRCRFQALCAALVLDLLDLIFV